MRVLMGCVSYVHPDVLAKGLKKKKKNRLNVVLAEFFWCPNYSSFQGTWMPRMDQYSPKTVF